jgi:hypothetical protein
MGHWVIGGNGAGKRGERRRLKIFIKKESRKRAIYISVFVYQLFSLKD